MIDAKEAEAKDWAALGERSLWQAVIANAINEWLHGPLRKRREAEQYLFRDEMDFPVVCRSAGMDAQYLRARLIRLRDQDPSLECSAPLAA